MYTFPVIDLASKFRHNSSKFKFHYFYTEPIRAGRQPNCRMILNFIRLCKSRNFLISTFSYPFRPLWCFTKFSNAFKMMQMMEWCKLQYCTTNTYITSFTFPLSMTNTTSSIVILVSAILVERTCGKKGLLAICYNWKCIHGAWMRAIQDSKLVKCTHNSCAYMFPLNTTLS